MTLEELKLRRQAGQHLLAPADIQTVVKDLCGVQAQFLSHALHGLSIRCNQVSTDGLVKSWTNRGTMHLFNFDNLPLFLHDGRMHFLRPVDTLESDAHISTQRKAYFSDLIVEAIAQGIDEREALKAVCEKAGMTESESQRLFDPWGGTIRALCEAGRICHTESLFLPKEHLRDIFNLAGIVRPAILVNGTVVGWWSLKNRKLKITLFLPPIKN